MVDIDKTYAYTDKTYAYICNWAPFSSYRLPSHFPKPVTPTSMLSLFSVCVKHMKGFTHLK